MFHYNSEFGFKLNPLLFLIMPETYEATSIYDFLESRGDVLTTSPLKAAAILPIGFIGQAVILFSDVILYKEDKGYRLSDITGDTFVNSSLWCHDSAKRRNIVEGRYYSVSIKYNPSSDKSWLFWADKLGPPSPETQTNLEGKISGPMGEFSSPITAH